MTLHFAENGPPCPRLPRPPWRAAVQFGVSAAVHIAVLLVAATVLPQLAGPHALPPVERRAASQIDTRRLVFIARLPISSEGGGGGGNRMKGPIRRAEGIGSDPITLHIRQAAASSADAAPADHLQGVLLDAKPLAFGTFDEIGLPSGGEPGALSTGPGTGGGVGTGSGTGIGSGEGPGVGPGSGGGTGGGVYRAGGAVSAPRPIVRVTPTYTTSALLDKIQGTVVLELIVTREGRPTQIRVVRSLESGLDEQAIRAAAQWRFEPGRRGGVPVDVLVTLMLDFWIR
jgi:periplasmic protein TonB